MSSDEGGGDGERILVTYERLLEVQDMRFECLECGKRFYHKSNLSNHMRTHADRNSGHKCEVCCKGFYSDAELHDHSRTEHGEQPVHFVCHLCRKTFSQKAHLKSHLATHPSDARYACELCGEAFPKKIKLRQHYRSHTWRRKPVKQVSRPQVEEDQVDQLLEVVQLD